MSTEPAAQSPAPRPAPPSLRLPAPRPNPLDRRAIAYLLRAPEPVPPFQFGEHFRLTQTALWRQIDRMLDNGWAVSLDGLLYGVPVARRPIERRRRAAEARRGRSSAAERSEGTPGRSGTAPLRPLERALTPPVATPADLAALLARRRVS